MNTPNSDKIIIREYSVHTKNRIYVRRTDQHATHHC